MNEKNISSTLSERFEEVVKRYPNHVAVVYQDKEYTYTQLNNEANRYARVLREKGVKANDIVGVYVPRSIEMVVAIFAVLKAGAAYLPMDTVYPIKRINYMISDSEFNVLMTLSNMVDDLDKNVQTIFLNHECNCKDTSNLSCVNQGKDLAYVIYTSGTSGLPKGVMVEHHNVIDFVDSYSALMNITEHDNWTLFHSVCFDYSVWELFGSLLNGSKLFIVPADITKDTDDFLRLVLEKKITIVNGTPQIIYNLYDAIENEKYPNLFVRIITISGAALNIKRIGMFFDRYPDITFINSYGITETTVITSYKIITKEDIEKGESNIGKCLPRTAFYLLDNNKNIVEKGQIGEIAVTGIGIARGYLNRQEITQEKYVYLLDICNDRIYLSGDLAFQNENNEFVYQGRKDRQVKIRGFRIELGEIENNILSFKEIKDVYVKASDINGSSSISAYLCYDNVIDLKSLRKFLLERIPDYMIPTLYYHVPYIPVNVNGKADESKIDELSLHQEILHADVTLPESENEKVLYETWSLILDNSMFGINDNFFVIGGDSIKIIQIVSKLKSRGYSVGVKDFYEYPTISKLALIMKKITVKAPMLENQNGALKLSGIQKYFFNNYSVNPNHYNQSVIVKLNQRVTTGLIRSFLNKLIQCHSMMRASFRKEESEYKQNINEKVLIHVAEIDWKNKSIHSDEVQQEFQKLQNSIDLGTAPLLKTAIVTVLEGSYLVLIVHHLIIDMVSFRIIMDDFQSIYQQYETSQKITLIQEKTTYRSWVDSSMNYYKEAKEEKEYWANISKHEAYKIEAERDGDNIVENQLVKSFCLSQEETKDLLTKIHSAYNTKIDDILISGLAMAFHDIFHRNGIMLSREGNGRDSLDESMDLSRTIGWFTSIYPVYIDADHESIEDIIIDTKETLRKIPNHGIGYNILQYAYECNFNIKPDIVFNYMGQFDKEISNISFGTVEEIAIGQNRDEKEKENNKFEFIGMIMNHELTMNVSYSSLQFTDQTIQNLLNSYKSALQQIIAHCKSKDTVSVTPSDLVYNKLSMKELENIFSKRKDHNDNTK